MYLYLLEFEPNLDFLK